MDHDCGASEHRAGGAVANRQHRDSFGPHDPQSNRGGWGVTHGRWEGSRRHTEWSQGRSRNAKTETRRCVHVPGGCGGLLQSTSPPAERCCWDKATPRQRGGVALVCNGWADFKLGGGSIQPSG